MLHPLLLRYRGAGIECQLVTSLSKMLESDWVTLLLVCIGPRRRSLYGLCTSTHQSGAGGPLRYAKSRNDLVHLSDDEQFKRNGLLVDFLFVSLVHRLCTHKQNGMVEEVTRNIAGRFCW